jgi:hypothetical protein
MSRPALGPTQPPVQSVPGVLSPGVKRGQGVMLTTHPHLVQRLWMSRSYSFSPPSASMACSGADLLTFYFVCVCVCVCVCVYIYLFIYLFYLGLFLTTDVFPQPFRFSWSHTIYTYGRTPLDEWPARRRGLYLHRTQHRNTRDKHPCPQRDSNPRPQQPSGRRHAP